jgi:hypothetical protein
MKERFILGCVTKSHVDGSFAPRGFHRHTIWAAGQHNTPPPFNPHGYCPGKLSQLKKFLCAKIDLMAAQIGQVLGALNQIIALLGRLPNHNQLIPNQAINTPDVNVDVSLTLLCKRIEDDPNRQGGLILVGTLIQRIVSNQVEEFEFRVNECRKSDNMIQVRTKKALIDPQSGRVGNSITADVLLPLVLKQDETVPFPFGLFKGTVTLELSTFVDANGVKYKPTILTPHAEADIREIVCLRNRDEDTFDESKLYDTVYPAPRVNILPAKIRGLYPAIEFSWSLSTPCLTPLVTTLFPSAVLTFLQWVNWIFIAKRAKDMNSYLTNAITIVLALVVVIPQVRSGLSANRNNSSVIDFAVFLVFFGTAMSAYPDVCKTNISEIGLLITSISFLLPFASGCYYRWKTFTIRRTGYSIEDLLPEEIYTPAHVLQETNLSRNYNYKFKICHSQDISKAKSQDWTPVTVHDVENTLIMEEFARAYEAKQQSIEVFNNRQIGLYDQPPLVFSDGRFFGRRIQVGHTVQVLNQFCEGRKLQLRHNPAGGVGIYCQDLHVSIISDRDVSKSLKCVDYHPIFKSDYLTLLFKKSRVNNVRMKQDCKRPWWSMIWTST